MVFWYNFVSSRKQIGKSVGRLVLSMFGLKALSRYLLDCNCYFLFIFLFIFCCTVVSSALVRQYFRSQLCCFYI